MNDRGLAGRIAIGALLVVLVAAAVLLAGYQNRHSFTPEKWRAEPEHRSRIVDDLLRDHPLLGLSEDEVVTLLGEHNNDYGYFNRHDRYVYYMGAERGLFAMDSEWLILDFADGVVTGWHITTD